MTALVIATISYTYDAAGRHGSTRALVDTLGALVQAFAYDAYGNHLAGTGLTSADAAHTDLLYSGEWMGQHGQQYLRARFYSPGREKGSGVFGRWIEAGSAVGDGVMRIRQQKDSRPLFVSCAG